MAAMVVGPNDVATGTWSSEGAYDDQDYAETEQL